ncbi:Uncharacterised protein [Mycobacteroides abscessus subsp. abscessus]|nr:Uncharacterised protein [Mycobacteroides abscessus subsp. abscessus]
MASVTCAPGGTVLSVLVSRGSDRKLSVPSSSTCHCRDPSVPNGRASICARMTRPTRMPMATSRPMPTPSSRFRNTTQTMVMA